VKWKTLVHNGVAFPPEYSPRGFAIRIKGKPFKLNGQQEELAWAWAKKKDTPYVNDSVFAANFVKDFLKLLPSEYKDCTIKDLDFGELHAAVDKEKATVLDPVAKKARSEERKKLREAMKAKYGWAEVDGNKFDVANYLVEPPGLFIGRGNHPIRGKWKPRVYSKDVTLNLGENAVVPPGEWKEVIHDHHSTWLARWVDKLTEKEKYVWLSDASTIRQERDMAKYDKAAKLAQNFDKVVDKIYEAMKSRDSARRMVATAAFLIYRLAMRVGDEKDPDEADTVGASTLRVEHVKLNGRTAEFDFLGKDSVRWQKSIELSGRDQVVFECLRAFTEKKKPTDLLFHDINSRTINEFFGTCLKGLTAKVFRTYLATEHVRAYLMNGNVKDGSDSQKIYHAKMANLQAAVMCNHKRAIPKNFEETLKKKQEKLEELKKAEAKTEKAQARLKAREEKMKLDLELSITCRDYNLGTSLRNYIDPRVVVAWCRFVGLDWTKVYTKTLQRKFLWTEKNTPVWEKIVNEAKAAKKTSGAQA
jgi:DNA topoisomerase-1